MAHRVIRCIAAPRSLSGGKRTLFEAGAEWIGIPR